MHLNTTLKCSLIALLFVTVVQALTDELEDEGKFLMMISLISVYIRGVFKLAHLAAVHRLVKSG